VILFLLVFLFLSWFKSSSIWLFLDLAMLLSMSSSLFTFLLLDSNDFLFYSLSFDSNVFSFSTGGLPVITVPLLGCTHFKLSLTVLDSILLYKSNARLMSWRYTNAIVILFAYKNCILTVLSMS